MNNLKNTSIIKLFLVVGIFSVAMALLESAVVVYLRELYYPTGFTVAFKQMPERIIMVELLRELATLVMLVSIGLLVGTTKKSKLAWFLYSFAVWDIFYYGWLKIFINWPISFFDWDILFLIPVTWLGPVLAPIICSMTMIILSIILLKIDLKNSVAKIGAVTWTLIISGSIFIYASFTKDYTKIIIDYKFYNDFFNLLYNKKFTDIAASYIPTSFSWVMFGLGELLILSGILKLIMKMKS
jgi:hypothetical protein